MTDSKFIPAEFDSSLGADPSVYSPEKLKEEMGLAKTDILKEVALLIIDVQNQFCILEAGGNAEIETISEHIQSSLTPEFRKAGIQVYAIYYLDDMKKKASESDFYKFTPDKNDTPITKTESSAFQGSNIKEILEKDHKKRLVVCGFNLSSCVLNTVMDARKAGFEVWLLQDLTGDNDHFIYENNRSKEVSLREMQAEGVVMTTSEKVLRQLRDLHELSVLKDSMRESTMTAGCDTQAQKNVAYRSQTINQ
ncbi:MAG: cysteine hydrolase [Alphaproteobacteria bacterium]|nr:cysteine hydrolase [Alphaproteobacteria bacterium]